MIYQNFYKLIELKIECIIHNLNMNCLIFIKMKIIYQKILKIQK